MVLTSPIRPDVSVSILQNIAEGCGREHPQIPFNSAYFKKVLYNELENAIIWL